MARRQKQDPPLFNDKIAVYHSGGIAPNACPTWQGDGPGGIPGLDCSYCRCPSCKGTWWIDQHEIDRIELRAKRKWGSDADLSVEQS
jgi:hypothetical protein